MTVPDTTDEASVCILIDAPEDGIVEEIAWVKVTTLTDSEERALAKLESAYPADEQAGGGEALSFECQSKQHLRPVGLPDAKGLVQDPEGGSTYHWPEVPWEVCGAEDENAQEFWRFELVDNG